MNYLLVQNRQTVILGPITWRQRFIQSEINELVEEGELSTMFTVPATEQGYIDIGDGFELIPAELITPNYDVIYQHLAGPFWVFDNNTATGSYTVHDLDINIVKGHLKQVVANERYRKQNLGITVTMAGVNFNVGTDVNTVNQFVSLAATTGNNTINYKSPTGFILATGTDIQLVADQINTYIQSQFNWELDIITQIDAASSVEELQAIVIIEPTTSAP